MAQTTSRGTSPPGAAAAAAAAIAARRKKKAEEEAAAAPTPTPEEEKEETPEEDKEEEKAPSYGNDDLGSGSSGAGKVDIKREDYQTYEEYMKAVKGEEARVKREAEAQKKALK